MADELCKNCPHAVEAHAFNADEVDEGGQPTADQRSECHADGCSCDNFEPGGELVSPTAVEPGQTVEGETADVEAPSADAGAGSKT